MSTEEEARQTWCPFVRFSRTLVPRDEPAANRWGDHINPELARCLGSECGVWRWDTEMNRTLTEQWATAKVSLEYRDAEAYKADYPEPKKLGFCGLAGKK